MRIDDTSHNVNQLKLLDDAAMRKPTDSNESAIVAQDQSRPTFSKVLEKTNESRIVKSGDTLIGIVREKALANGVFLNGSQEYRLASQVASLNQISNPNRIYPGQNVQLSAIQERLEVLAKPLLDQGGNAPTPSSVILAQRNTSIQANLNVNKPMAFKTAVPFGKDVAAALPATSQTTHVVLNQTLDRAVARGFVPQAERQDVYNKIIQVAEKHKFSPDDFARLTLMESDGMNPLATNQRCHGIIQFCDGPARGAASVGWGQSPKSILRLSVYQQLHLVDTYFDKVGLKKDRPVTLDELYLAVLQPAARSETRPEAPLGIPGKQARHLYEGQNPQAPMTRVSIVQGLVQNAIERLSGFSAKPARLEANKTVEDNAFNQKRTWIR
jgi:nucleoid-associated protein YgaU